LLGSGWERAGSFYANDISGTAIEELHTPPQLYTRKGVECKYFADVPHVFVGRVRLWKIIQWITSLIGGI
jgi:hypothetical protein